MPTLTAPTVLRPDLGESYLAPILPDDHAGYLWIAGLLGVIYSSLAAFLRYHIKRRLYGLDDYLIAISTLVSYAQAAVLFYALSHGLGKFNSDTSEDQWRINGVSYLASGVLSVISLCLSKCSIVALLLRIFAAETGRGWHVCLCFLAICCVWGVGSIIAITAACDPSGLLSPPGAEHMGRCPEQFLRWQIITGLDVVTDVLIGLLPGVLVWSVNMSRGLKMQVIVAFAFRLPLAMLSVLHLVYLGRSFEYLTSEPQFTVIASLVIQQIELCWSLISATIPNMKSFMKVFSNALSVEVAWDDEENDNFNGNLSMFKSFAMQSLRRGPPDAGGRPRAGPGGRERLPSELSIDEEDEYMYAPDEDMAGVDDSTADPANRISLRPDPINSETTVLGGKDHEPSKRDPVTDDENSLRLCGSRDMIIKKEVHWNARRESKDMS